MTVLEFLRHELDNKDLKSGTRFDELGLDSLDFLDMIQQFEQRFSVKVGDLELARINTVGDLEKLCDDYVAG